MTSSSCRPDLSRRRRGVRSEFGSGLRQPGSGAEPVRRNRGDDSRFWLCRSRSKGRVRVTCRSAASILSRARSSAVSAAAGHSRQRACGSVPQQHSALAWARVFGRGGGRGTGCRQWPSRAGRLGTVRCARAHTTRLRVRRPPRQRVGGRTGRCGGVVDGARRRPHRICGSAAAAAPRHPHLLGDP